MQSANEFNVITALHVINSLIQETGCSKNYKHDSVFIVKIHLLLNKGKQEVLIH